MKTIGLCVLALPAFVLAACNANHAGSAGSAAPHELSVAFNWCGASSPSFRISNIPEGASKLRLRMTDRHVASYNHGGGEVPIAGGTTASIPCGRLTGSYNGPNPPAPQVHDYEWIVTAFDANGKVIARGSALRKFPE